MKKILYILLILSAVSLHSKIKDLQDTSYHYYYYMNIRPETGENDTIRNPFVFVKNDASSLKYDLIFEDKDGNITIIENDSLYTYLKDKNEVFKFRYAPTRFPEYSTFLFLNYLNGVSYIQYNHQKMRRTPKAKELEYVRAIDTLKDGSLMAQFTTVETSEFGRMEERLIVNPDRGRYLKLEAGLVSEIDTSMQHFAAHPIKEPTKTHSEMLAFYNNESKRSSFSDYKPSKTAEVKSDPLEGHIQNGDTLKFDRESYKDYTTGEIIGIKSLMKSTINMIYFWGTGYDYCRYSTPVLNDIYKKYKDKINFFSVNCEEGREPSEREKVLNTYVDYKGIEFPVISSCQLKEENNINLVPTIVVVDNKGVVIQVITGLKKDSYYEKIFEKVVGE